MSAAYRRAPKLSQMRAQGTAVARLDVPENFKKWLVDHRLPTVESVYGYFYNKTPEKRALLQTYDMNFERLYDRLCKVIPPEKVRHLNSLAEQHYQVDEA